MNLAGRVAIVTGASRGIGKAIAAMLAEKGCSVVINYRKRKNNALEVKELVEGFGSKAIIVLADVGKEAEARKLVRAGVKEFGRIDFLVNNAGVAAFKNFSEMNAGEMSEIIDTNLNGILFCTREVLPVMLKQGSGKIVNVSSGLGKHGYGGMAVYCASKFGVIGFTESLAEEVREKNIVVCAICPEGVNTDMYRSVRSVFDDKPGLEPEDVARAVVKVCRSSSMSESGKAIDVY